MYSPVQDVLSQFIGILVDVMIRSRRFASTEKKKWVDYQQLSTKIKISTEKLELHKIEAWINAKIFPQVFEIKIASTDQIIERWIFDCHSIQGPHEPPHQKTLSLFFKNFYSILHILPAYEYCTNLPQYDILVATKPFSAISDDLVQKKNFQLVFNREVLQITVEYTSNFKIVLPNQLLNTGEINSETSSLCDSLDSSPQISELRDSYPPIPPSRDTSPPPDQFYEPEEVDDFEEVDLPTYSEEPQTIVHNNIENEFINELFSAPCPFDNSQVNLEPKRVREKILFPVGNPKRYTPFLKPSILTSSPIHLASSQFVNQLGIEVDQKAISDCPKEFPFSSVKRDDPNDLPNLLRYLDSLKTLELSLFTENN